MSQPIGCIRWAVGGALLRTFPSRCLWDVVEVCAFLHVSSAGLAQCAAGGEESRLGSAFVEMTTLTGSASPTHCLKPQSATC